MGAVDISRFHGLSAGKIMMFCDAYKHSAFNNTDHKRYVFLFDVLKPEYAGKKSYICSGLLAQLALFFIAENLKIKKITFNIFFIFQ